MLTLGVSIESISKMLGHTNISTSQKYARILNTKLENEVNKVKPELDGLKKYYAQIDTSKGTNGYSN